MDEKDEVQPDDKCDNAAAGAAAAAADDDDDNDDDVDDDADADAEWPVTVRPSVVMSCSVPCPVSYTHLTLPTILRV